MLDILGWLLVFSLVVYVSKLVIVKSVDTEKYIKMLGSFLMSLPRPIMMLLMAVPEQLVLANFEPKMPLLKRLSVSVAMYLVHFAWNGMVMKPKRSHNELVWILGTALFALVLGSKPETFVALVAADSVMTLSLRGLA